jgi:hypothetical protein
MSKRFHKAFDLRQTSIHKAVEPFSMKKTEGIWGKVLMEGGSGASEESMWGLAYWICSSG